jgi:hypothetical protein
MKIFCAKLGMTKAKLDGLAETRLEKSNKAGHHFY